ncbi:16S rRNA processing protein RimM [Fluviicoccus keumensis]|uniref:Ribosome maturation factor RimM n=1 Tax=Fluviicoccus keumensis TaxID=1435465 RepID=A0A4Q7ZAG2_9GAMM|nr:ribosome maturation factor RimM [Fluviicoccus keumensis]RZU47582.1 16S rRNA processing protein RimM [Fluviicoccus keumensis]
MSDIPSPDQLVEVGRLQAAYGIKGWVWVYSNTDPIANIFAYAPWYARIDGRMQELRVAEWREQGKGLVIRIDGVTDRNGAEGLKGTVLWVNKSCLPELPDGDYYWSDLLDLSVFLDDGRLLGQVHSLMETGSNDVLVIRPVAGSIDDRERLVPWLPERVVRHVDLASRRVVVDWDPEF